MGWFSEEPTRLATGTITISEVTTLNHKLLDNTVECRALISISLLTSSKGTVSSHKHQADVKHHVKHTGSSRQSVINQLAPRIPSQLQRTPNSHLWHSLAIQSYLDPSQQLVSMVDIKIHLLIVSYAAHVPATLNHLHTLLVIFGPFGSATTKVTAKRAQRRMLSAVLPKKTITWS